MDPKRRSARDPSSVVRTVQVDFLRPGVEPTSGSWSPLEAVLDDPIDFEEYAQSRLQDFAKR